HERQGQDGRQVNAAQRGGGEVDGGQGDAELLAGDARPEADGRVDGDRLAGGVVCGEEVVLLAEVLQQQVLGEQGEPARRVPGVGVGQGGEVLLAGAHLDEAQPDALDEGPEVAVGDDGDGVPAAGQLDAEGDERVDVAVAADGREEYLHETGLLLALSAGP